MVPRYLYALVLLLLSCVAYAAPSTNPCPSIVCRDPAYIFPDADETQMVDHVFSIGNEGNAPLHIKDIRGCCGATNELASNMVEPGTNTALHIRFSLRGRHGSFKKSFYVLNEL